MIPTLSEEEVRVLGALVEKDLATPEYYPLSLNALTLACNQKTSREPVTAYEETQVREIVTSLRNKGLSVEIQGGRANKFEHRLGERLNLGRGELAILAVLMLRGPQTLNELRERTSRMHEFDDTEAVTSALRRLPDGIVIEVPRRPGWKENRWAQLLAGEPQIPEVSTVTVGPSRDDRVAKLEEQLAQLRVEFDEFRRKFE